MSSRSSSGLLRTSLETRVPFIGRGLGPHGGRRLDHHHCADALRALRSSQSRALVAQWAQYCHARGEPRAARWRRNAFAPTRSCPVRFAFAACSEQAPARMRPRRSDRRPCTAAPLNLSSWRPPYRVSRGAGRVRFRERRDARSDRRRGRAGPRAEMIGAA